MKKFKDWYEENKDILSSGTVKVKVYKTLTGLGHLIGDVTTAQFCINHYDLMAVFFGELYLARIDATKSVNVNYPAKLTLYLIVSESENSDEDTTES